MIRATTLPYVDIMTYGVEAGRADKAFVSNCIKDLCEYLEVIHELGLAQPEVRIELRIKDAKSDDPDLLRSEKEKIYTGVRNMIE